MYIHTKNYTSIATPADILRWLILSLLVPKFLQWIQSFEFWERPLLQIEISVQNLEPNGKPCRSWWDLIWTYTVCIIICLVYQAERVTIGRTTTDYRWDSPWYVKQACKKYKFFNTCSSISSSFSLTSQSKTRVACLYVLAVYFGDFFSPFLFICHFNRHADKTIIQTKMLFFFRLYVPTGAHSGPNLNCSQG